MPVANAEEIIRNLGRRVAHGEVVLFTGAGFSRGASDRFGRPVAQVDDLRREIWDLLYPGVEIDGDAQLSNLYEVALVREPRRLERLMRERLEIDEGSVQAFHREWLSVPWRNAYTLNMDDLEAAVAATTADLPRAIRGVSGLNAALPVPGGPDLLYVHLNGMLADLPNVTFGPGGYGERHAFTAGYFDQVALDLLTFPVVFVGTTLNESPLWHYIALRGSKGERGIREERPRSYLVTPSLSSDRKDLLENYNIEWVPVGAEEFARDVLSHLADQKGAGYIEIMARARRSEDHPRLDRVADMLSLPYPPDSQYLIGARPSWDDIRVGRAVEREFEAGIDIDELPPFLLVTGTAGSGTTTTLMRLAAKAAFSGRAAWWLGSDRNFRIRELRNAIRDLPEHALIFVDDIDTLGGDAGDIARFVQNEGSHVHLLAGTRSSRVDEALEEACSGTGGRQIVVPPLEDSDIERLLVALEADNKLGVLTGLGQDQRFAVFAREAGRQLLVAMIKATSGQELEDKTATEYRALPALQRRTYGVVSLASSLRFDLALDEILAASQAVSNEGAFAVDRLVGQKLVVATRGMYSSRHRLVADIVVTEMRISHEALLPYIGIVQALAAKHGAAGRGQRVNKLLKALINHVRVNTFFSTNEAQRLYASIEELLKDDYHYWLQRGSYELDFGSLHAARSHLGAARSMAEHDYRVESTWAYYLMKSACSDPRASEAAEKIAEAKVILEATIAQHGHRDSYAYHVLGSQLLSWTHRAPMTVEERRSLLREVREIVARGVDAHPRNRELSQLQADVEREYLMTAVDPDT